MRGTRLECHRLLHAELPEKDAGQVMPQFGCIGANGGCDRHNTVSIPDLSDRSETALMVSGSMFGIQDTDRHGTRRASRRSP